MKKFDVVGIEMPCMDMNINLNHFPRPGVGDYVQNLSWQGGNKVSSGMVACARLGIKNCAMMGSIGGDIFGRFIINDFKRHGINTSAMRVQEDKTSSLSIVLSDTETNNRTFLFRTGSVENYEWRDINEDYLRSTKYLFISQCNPLVEAAMDIARAAGAQVFIDADGYSETVINLLPKINVFVGSEHFYNRMFNDNHYEQNCRGLMAKGPHTVLFTFGEKGCAGVSGEGFFTLPAFDVEVADTVGAGDVFHGAFLAGLLEKRTVKDAALLASAVAAIKCTRIGGRAGIPSKPTVERFLKDGYIDYTEIDERVRFYERGLDNE